MLWILIFAGDGLQPSLQLIKMSRVGFLVTGKPWSTHGNPYLFVSLWNIFGWSWPASDPSWFTILSCLFSFYKTLAVSRVFQFMPWLVNFVFTSFVYSYVKNICGLSIHLCLNFKWRDLTLMSSDSVILMLLL